MGRFPDDPGTPGLLDEDASADSAVVDCRGAKSVQWLVTGTNHPGDADVTFTPVFYNVSGVETTAALANATVVLAPAAAADLTKGVLVIYRAGQATATPHDRIGAVQCKLTVTNNGPTSLTAVVISPTVHFS
jgi:hypothetical protein